MIQHSIPLVGAICSGRHLKMSLGEQGQIGRRTMQNQCISGPYFFIHTYYIYIFFFYLSIYIYLIFVLLMFLGFLAST